MSLIAGCIGLVVGGALGFLLATRTYPPQESDGSRNELRAIAAGIEGLAARWNEPDEIRMRDLEDAVARLPQRWEEFRGEAKRAEARARAIVRDAQRGLEEAGFESAALTAQAAELRRRDGDGSEGEGLRAVREDVGDDEAGTPDEAVDALEVLRRRKFGG